MLSKEEAKNILGKIFLKEYGEQFIYDNIKHLGTLDTVENNYLFVKFILHDENHNLVNEIKMGSNEGSKVLMVCGIDLETEEIKIY